MLAMAYPRFRTYPNFLKFFTQPSPAVLGVLLPGLRGLFESLSRTMLSSSFCFYFPCHFQRSWERIKFTHVLHQVDRVDRHRVMSTVSSGPYGLLVSSRPESCHATYCILSRDLLTGSSKGLFYCCFEPLNHICVCERVVRHGFEQSRSKYHKMCCYWRGRNWNISMITSLWPILIVSDYYTHPKIWFFQNLCAKDLYPGSLEAFSVFSGLNVAFIVLAKDSFFISSWILSLLNVFHHILKFPVT